MEDEDEYTDTPPSHILYEGKTMIYIKNKISSNTLAISRNNFEMNNISFKTISNLSNFTRTKVYGILGIVNFHNTPCLVFGTEFDVATFYLDKCIYNLKNINYIILTNLENNIKSKIEEEFNVFKKSILNTHLIFSNYFDLTMPYYQQIGRNLNETNSFLYNLEIIKPFLLNNNLKNKNEFYTSFIDGYIFCYNHKIGGQDLILYVLYRKHSEFDYYDCEITIRYSTDIFNYIYGNKIGNEKFNENFIKYYEKKNGLILNCSNIGDENIFKKILPYFNYIKYNGKDLNEKIIENFFDTQNKEIKKTQYFFTCKDPYTNKSKSKFKQAESSQNGACIFVFNNIESMTTFNKYFNSILLTNYFSQYQKEKDFKKQNNDFINVNKIEKIDYIYSVLKDAPNEYYKILTKFNHFNFKNYIYNDKDKKESKSNNLDNLNLFIGTYNVSAIEPKTILSKFDTTSFIFPKKFSEKISKNNLPDIIYICFEEIVELNANNVLISSNQDIVDLYTKKITSEICKHYPYILKQQKSLVGVLTLFFIKSELDDQIDNLTVVENKTGDLGLGNKGNFIIKFKLKSKEFSLVNGHLTAGDKKENFDRRIMEIKDIFNNINKSKNPNALYFITGDLNFRIELPKEKFNEICCGKPEANIDEKQAKNKIEVLKKYDQMNQVKEIFKKEKLFEENINFPPTYKYNKMSTIYNGKRTPSWTDRILYKQDNCIKCIFYDTIDLYISDHKPLVGLFKINLQ